MVDQETLDKQPNSWNNYNLTKQNVSTAEQSNQNKKPTAYISIFSTVIGDCMETLVAIIVKVYYEHIYSDHKF